MTEAELRDHAAELLSAVVQDIGIAQTSEEHAWQRHRQDNGSLWEASRG